MLTNRILPRKTRRLLLSLIFLASPHVTQAVGIDDPSVGEAREEMSNAVRSLHGHIPANEAQREEVNNALPVLEEEDRIKESEIYQRLHSDLENLLRDATPQQRVIRLKQFYRECGDWLEQIIEPEGNRSSNGPDHRGNPSTMAGIEARFNIMEDVISMFDTMAVSSDNSPEASSSSTVAAPSSGLEDDVPTWVISH